MTAKDSKALIIDQVTKESPSHIRSFRFMMESSSHPNMTKMVKELSFELMPRRFAVFYYDMGVDTMSCLLSWLNSNSIDEFCLSQFDAGGAVVKITFCGCRMSGCIAHHSYDDSSELIHKATFVYDFLETN